MHIALGASFLAVKGYAAAEVGETYTRAQQLCQYLADPQYLFPVLRGLWSYYLVRAELQTAHALASSSLPWHSKSKTLSCFWERTVL